MRDYITKLDNAAPLPAGILTADEDNVRFSELKSAVQSSGITVDPVGGPSTDEAMLAQSMARYASGGIFCRDVGVLNAYIVTALGTFVPPKQYFHGMRVSFYPGNTCTGASTLNAFAIGVKKLLRPNASVLQPSDLYTNVLTEAYYDEAADSGAGAWRVAPWALYAPIITAGGGGGGGGVAPLDGEGIDVDGSYHVSLNFPGLDTATPVDADLFAFYSITGVHHRKVTLATLRGLLTSGSGTSYYQTASETVLPGDYSVNILVMPFINIVNNYSIIVSCNKGLNNAIVGTLAVSLNGGSTWIDISQFASSIQSTDGTWSTELIMSLGNAFSSSYNNSGTNPYSNERFYKVSQIITSAPADVRFRINNHSATLTSVILRGKRW